MAIIGNRNDARAVLEYHRAGMVVRAKNENIVKVGNGAFRYCYTLNGVLYKVGAGYSDSDYDSAKELRNAQYLRRRFKNNDGMVGAYVRIPKTSGFSFSTDRGKELVIAMEFIDGDHPSNAPYDRAAREELFSLGFRDMHGANFFVEKSTGYLVPVDLASPRTRSAVKPDFRVFARDGGYDDLVQAEEKKWNEKQWQKKRRPLANLPGFFDSANACNNESCRGKRVAKNKPDVRWCWDLATPVPPPVRHVIRSAHGKTGQCGLSRCHCMCVKDR